MDAGSAYLPFFPGIARIFRSYKRLVSFDLASPTLRILCCSECFEPVAAEPSGNVVHVHCGYCGKDDARELVPTVTVPTEGAYRGRVPGPTRESIALDLTQPKRRLRKGDRRKLETEWRQAMATGHDRNVAYVGVTLAQLLEVVFHDELRARAVLETTLEHLSHVALRALVAARLANLASRHGAIELAERWLDRIPKDLRVAEVDAARKTTRALILRARKEWDGVLDATRGDFVPPYRFLALALRMDAFEQRGELRTAYSVWNSMARGGGSNQILASARVNGLAPATRKRIITFGFAALGVVFLMICALVTLLQAIADHQPIAWWVVILGFASFVALMIARWRLSA